MSQLILLADFGSTYTKIVVIDLDGENIVARAQAPSTVDTDISLGYMRAFEEIKCQLGYHSIEFRNKLCCSSAAGGLRIVCCGLVPSLTSKAAMLAAWSAGGKIIETYSYELTESQVDKISEQLKPDIVLLVGGTDGGDKNTIINNVKLVSKSSMNCPIILGCNLFAADEAEKILRAARKEVIVSENVLPELERLNIAPVNNVIRSLFIERIINAKGLENVKSLVNPNVIPTPLAVFNGACVLANGTSEIEGLGELVVIDIGGSTTDVVSVCGDKQTDPNVIKRGIPEPFAKRTVEGDMGIRINASAVIKAAGEERIKQVLSNIDPVLIDRVKIKDAAEYLTRSVNYLPQDTDGQYFDEALASICLEVAVTRHAGKLEKIFDQTQKEVFIQHGKDLRDVTKVIGTGGIFRNALKYNVIFQGAQSNNILELKPIAPEFYVDSSYIFYAIGLLSSIFPSKAIKLMKKSLVKVL